MHPDFITFFKVYNLPFTFWLSDLKEAKNEEIFESQLLSWQMQYGRKLYHGWFCGLRNSHSQVYTGLSSGRKSISV